MSLASKVATLEYALEEAKKALEFYGGLVYSHKMGLPPEVQWIAENALGTIKMCDGMKQQKTIVVFDMWGQRCQTVFDENSELKPLDWLNRTKEKGWLLPVEVKLENGTILHTQKELERILYR